MFTINLSIDAAGVDTINANSQFVTLVKSVGSTKGDKTPVAWITVAPFETTKITWEEEYFIYATDTALQGGATIQLTSQTTEPAQEGFTYTFKNNVFDQATGTGDTYNAVNESPSNDLSFGLAQPASINEALPSVAPLNVVKVLSNENVAFTPEETISIFLSSNTNNGSVLSEVTSGTIPFTLTSQTPTANIGFNDSNNTFFVVSIGA